MTNIGDNFQQKTKYHRDEMSGGRLDWSSQPALYKEYPNCEVVELPIFEPPEDDSLFRTITNRKSIRNYKNIAIRKETLSYLLWASSGISREEGGYVFRTAPSAGALYPIETYVVVNNVEEIDGNRQGKGTRIGAENGPTWGLI